MPVKWTKRLIASESFESAGVLDVNGDGIPDIVSGSFWYEGPDFRKRHWIGDIFQQYQYHDDFSTIGIDVNGDGRIDVISGGWFGKALRWHENTGKEGDWPVHIIDEPGNIETSRAWDVDGDEEQEVVPNTPGAPLCVYKLQRDKSGRGTGKFTKHVILNEPHGHGLGFGDVNGDGRGDLVVTNGWLEQPKEGLGGKWTFHKGEFDLGPSASIPIIVADVNGDGLNDLIVGQSHAYGLDWWEQRRDGSGKRSWIKHPIDPFNSQYHDLHWADIDGDGKPELVTGKRFRAHNDGDPGAYDDIGVYYFKRTGEGFAKQVIAYGPEGVGAGCGIHFYLADLRGTGRLDVVAPGKDGLHVFFNEGA